VFRPNETNNPKLIEIAEQKTNAMHAQSDNTKLNAPENNVAGTKRDPALIVQEGQKSASKSSNAYHMVLTDVERQEHLLRCSSRNSAGSRATAAESLDSTGATSNASDTESEAYDGFFGSWRKSVRRMFAHPSKDSGKSWGEGDIEDFALDLLELSLAVCDASADLCRQFATKATQDSKRNYKALKRLTMLARTVGLISNEGGPQQENGSSEVLGSISSQLPVPVRDLAKAFVQDDLTAFEFGEGGEVPADPMEVSATPSNLAEASFGMATELQAQRPGGLNHSSSSGSASGDGTLGLTRPAGINHSGSLSSADGTLGLPRPGAGLAHSSSVGSDGTLGLPRKTSLGHSSSLGSTDGVLGIPRVALNHSSSVSSTDGTLGLPRLLGLNHSGSNVSSFERQGTGASVSGRSDKDEGFMGRHFGLMRRSSSNCSNGPDLNSLGRRLGLLRGGSTGSQGAQQTPRPLGLYHSASNTSSLHGSEDARRLGLNRSTSNFSSFSCTSFVDFNRKHGIIDCETPSFLQFLATVHGAGKHQRIRPGVRRLKSIQEVPLANAFDKNRQEVEEIDCDRISYYSSQEMGKASVFQMITSTGSVTLSTQCLKTQAAWQRSLIEQQRSLLGLVSRKLHQAEEKTRLDTAVSEDQRELLRNFRKIVTRTDEEPDVQVKELFVIIVETSPELRAEITQLCQLLEYRCKVFGSLTAAEAEIANMTESSGQSARPTFLVLLGTSWLDRELSCALKQDSVYVTLTSRAEEFELVGNQLSASSDSQIRSVLRERGIREYLLHPLSLEDMRRTVEAALQRRWAEEFLVCETLGRGTSGVVHRVKRLRDGHIFAMKEVPTRLLREKDRQSLLQEVAFMQQFDWPSIVSLVSAWENRQQRLHYIVMPFNEGGSLKSHISQALLADAEGADTSFARSNSAFSSMTMREKHLGAWYVQSLHGLSYLHGHGVLHRDIKPDNLVLGHGGALQICDLGSAMHLPGKGPHPQKDVCIDAPITTALYSAPEVAEWQKSSTASDMWSLGATFYEAIMLQTLAPPCATPQELSQWLEGLAKTGSPTSSNSAVQEYQKALEALELQAGIAGDYDFQGHGQLQELLRLSPVQRPAAAVILSSSSNMSVLRSAMCVSKSTTAEVDKHMKDTKRMLQKSLSALGVSPLVRKI